MAVAEESRRREGLIRQNPRDRVVCEIQTNMEEARALKEAERRQKTDTRMSRSKVRFAKTFLALANEYFSYSPQRVRSLTNEELLALEKIIARRALGRSMVSRALSWNPAGLVVFAANNAWKALNNGIDHDPKAGKSWSYRYLRGKLKGAYGNDWFPLETVRRGYY